MLPRIPILWVLVAALLTACAAEPRTAVPVTLETVCQQEQNTLVTIIGYLHLYDVMLPELEGDTYIYYLYLSPVASRGIIRQGDVRIRVQGSRLPKPNQIAKLPLDYTEEDLKIYLNDGTVVGQATRLRITGTVTAESVGCTVTVTTLEASSALK